MSEKEVCWAANVSNNFSKTMRVSIKILEMRNYSIYSVDYEKLLGTLRLP